MGHHFDISRYPASGARLVASDLVDGCRAMRGIDTDFPVSEGQLGLARWLADRRMTIANGNFADLRASLLYDGDLVERLLAGEIVPDETTAADIQRMTQDAVRPQHWEMWLSQDGQGYIRTRKKSRPYWWGQGHLHIRSAERLLYQITRFFIRDRELAAAMQRDGLIVRYGTDETCWEASELLIKVLREKGEMVAVEPDQSKPSIVKRVAASAGDEAGQPEVFPRGVLGRELPFGALFQTYENPADTSSFVVAGCGLAIRLDEATAIALVEAVSLGRVRLGALRKEALAA